MKQNVFVWVRPTYVVVPQCRFCCMFATSVYIYISLHCFTYYRHWLLSIIYSGMDLFWCLNVSWLIIVDIKFAGNKCLVWSGSWRYLPWHSLMELPQCEMVIPYIYTSKKKYNSECIKQYGRISLQPVSMFGGIDCREFSSCFGIIIYTCMPYDTFSYTVFI